MAMQFYINGKNVTAKEYMTQLEKHSSMACKSKKQKPPKK